VKQDTLVLWEKLEQWVLKVPQVLRATEVLKVLLELKVKED
jgi:hypothetical protein